LNHHLFDERLRCAAAGTLADFYDARARARMREAAPVHQRIDQHHIGPAESARRLQRHELGISGAGADKVDLSAHATFSFAL